MLGAASPASPRQPTILFPNVCARDLLSAEEQGAVARLLKHGTHRESILFGVGYRLAGDGGRQEVRSRFGSRVC